MRRYAFRRTAIVIPLFFGVTLLLFLLMNAAPGTAADLMGDGGSAASARVQLMSRFGLDRPVLVRYLAWLGGLLTGDLGLSYRTGQPVAGMLLQRLPASLLLTGVGVLLAVAVAIPLGIAAAAKPRGVCSRLADGLSVFGFSAPGFLLSLGGIYIFAVRLRWLPAAGLSGAGFLLPLAVVAISSLGGILRQTVSACAEVLGKPFVRAARAKGLPERLVLLRHVFRVALPPILTTVLGHIPHIIGGSMVVERIFGWPGMGSLLFAAVAARDYNVIMGQTVAVTAAVLLSNLALDLLYALLDPRVTNDRRGAAP